MNQFEKMMIDMLPEDAYPALLASGKSSEKAKRYLTGLLAGHKEVFLSDGTVSRLLLLAETCNFWHSDDVYHRTSFDLAAVTRITGDSDMTPLSDLMGIIIKIFSGDKIVLSSWAVLVCTLLPPDDPIIVALKEFSSKSDQNRQ